MLFPLPGGVQNNTVFGRHPETRFLIDTSADSHEFIQLASAATPTSPREDIKASMRECKKGCGGVPEGAPPQALQAPRRHCPESSKTRETQGARGRIASIGARGDASPLHKHGIGVMDGKIIEYLAQTAAQRPRYPWRQRNGHAP